MGDGVVTKERLAITVPPRSSFDSSFGGGSFTGFSPGPMTLVSSFFSETGNSSLSQLLAGGAMSSPISKSFFVDDSSTSGSSGGGGGGGDEVSAYRQKRPLELMGAQSPLFMVPPGFSPSGLLDSPLQRPFGMSHQQALTHVTAKAAVSHSYMQLQADFQQSLGAAPTETPSDQSHPLAADILLCNSVGILPEPVTVGTTVVASLEMLKHDGYSWRKYGQKQVKASEYPRSYYKCTHVGCLVKKKVGRSHDGHVTEITYKGQHHHGPSASNKRARDGSGSVLTSNSHVYLQHGSQDQTSNITYTPTFIAPGDGQLSNQPSSQLHPVPSAHDGSHEKSVSVNVDDGNDQQNVKKRCMEEAGSAGHSSTHTTVTESRIIVQTRSDVDLLDDGYKWRKYGQKVVKGNSYPRSYYRCTYAECNVRKHVERALTDTKNVITTYNPRS